MPRRDRYAGGLDRRRFLRGSAAAGLVGLGLGCRGRGMVLPADAGVGAVADDAGVGAPAIVTSTRARPSVPYGVQSGDIGATSAVLWAASDRPARMLVELATSDRFHDVRRIVGPAALIDTDFTAKLAVTALPPGQDVFYRVTFQDLGDLSALSEPVVGHLRTAPRERRSVRFLWSGDTCGQGWGIDPDRGGLGIYRAMRERRPDFFIHCGDYVYADGPIAAAVPLSDGAVWRNLVLEGKHKVAETLAEFRASYKYNLLDEHVRAFNAEVPQLVQWDDHETTNNWYPGERLDLDRTPYREPSVALLAARGQRAFREWTPILSPAHDPERIYRSFSYGPLVDVFMLDMRSYRGPNSPNRQPASGPDTAFLGRAQLSWLKRGLAASRARWKVIAADMPIGLIVPDGRDHFEAVANGGGPPLGREHEIAELLAFIDGDDIDGVVWLTADVHYTAAHHYDPGKARFTRFRPFWEFVSGPLHAGSFGPNPLDDTFGPEVRFQKAPGEGEINAAPNAGNTYFGEVDIDGASEAMTVTLRDGAGERLYSVELAPS